MLVYARPNPFVTAMGTHLFFFFLPVGGMLLYRAAICLVVQLLVPWLKQIPCGSATHPSVQPARTDVNFLDPVIPALVLVGPPASGLTV